MAIRVKTVEGAVLSLGKRVLFPPHPYARSVCTGFGIELGAAAHNPFDLDGSVNAAPEQFDPIYVQSQIDLCGSYALVDVICNGHNIPFPATSVNYCISSHVIEHFPNPIAGFLEWNRILKDDGIVFMIFPKRDALESDRERNISTLEEIVATYDKYGNMVMRGSAYDMHPDQKNNLENFCYEHFFVYTLDLMVSLITICNERFNLHWDIFYTEETDAKAGNGHTFVAQKRSCNGLRRFGRRDNCLAN
jgi:SAM-dependent methyltransferase